eukprot:251811-Pelagomonas_calceolata.AAC.1
MPSRSEYATRPKWSFNAQKPSGKAQVVIPKLDARPELHLAQDTADEVKKHGREDSPNCAHHIQVWLCMGHKSMGWQALRRTALSDAQRAQSLEAHTDKRIQRCHKYARHLTGFIRKRLD